MKTKFLMLFMLVSVLSYGQSSPAEKAKGTTNGADITIEYSSPRVKGRTVYGDLVPYAKVWRAGANKNTTIEFSKDVTINGQELAAGKYGFFITPNEDGAWSVIFNSKNDGWGAYDRKEAEDVLTFRVKAKGIDNQEELLYEVTNKGIRFAWADQSFEMKVK